jgi:alpha-glucosidase
VEAGRIAYSIRFKDRTILKSGNLSISFNGKAYESGLLIGHPQFREAQEKYNLILGKTSSVNDPYREVRVPIQTKGKKQEDFVLVVRAFNDGVAFRYEFPGSGELVLTDENNSFNFPDSTLIRGLFLPGYHNSHEGPYHTVLTGDLRPDTLVDLPALFETPKHVFIAITEANLLDYAGMYLVKENGILRSKLSPLPGQTEVKVRASLPHHSPWRVFLISDRIGTLIESNLITDLAEPCRIRDLSWIKAGKTTFPWWNGNIVPDTLNAPGNNFVTNKYYIDFCARNGIAFHSVVEYGLHEWYSNDGAGFVPGPHADVTRPVPGLDMQKVCDYAKSKGVGIRVWVYWSALYRQIDSAFAQFEKWGIRGMMVDFMDRDDQQMVNIQTEILEKAAAHHLHIQFHGAYKPTGLSRTYPNEFTREGTRNYEVNKWGPGLSPDHDIYMPFTRLLAGSTDYHLGGFRAVPDSLYQAQYSRPLMLGTRCHMLAMYVVLENCLSMVCDYPAAYEGQPGFEFIRELPESWDETKVPSALVEQYVAIARRRGRDWYLGAINNHQKRTVRIPLNFLGEGSYRALIFRDAGDDATDPDHLLKETRKLDSKDELSIELASGGGTAIQFIRE